VSRGSIAVFPFRVFVHVVHECSIAIVPAREFVGDRRALARSSRVVHVYRHTRAETFGSELVTLAQDRREWNPVDEPS
jgi:hypothetical protein